MTDIRRYETKGRPVFITAVCHRRMPYLNTDPQKELLLLLMRELKASSGFSVHAYVILDDHFHWLITPRSQPFPKVMQSIKLRFVHRYKKAMGHKGNITLWQRRFWDHVIRDSADQHRHMDYIHYNPVKHGCVARPLDYKWSSFGTHVQIGNYDANWGANTVSESVQSMDLE